MYAWNGLWGETGVEMHRPQQGPCPTSTASECVTLCTIRRDSDRSAIHSFTEQEWRKPRPPSSAIAHELKDAPLSPRPHSATHRPCKPPWQTRDLCPLRHLLMELENIVANTVLLKAREGKWTREAELGGTRNFAGLSRVVLCCVVGRVMWWEWWVCTAHYNR